SYGVDQIVGGIGRVGIAGHWLADAAPSQQLVGTQLVTGAGDGNGFVNRVGAAHFKLAQHGTAVASNTCADAGNDSVELQHLRVPQAFVQDCRIVGGDVHVTLQNIH